MPDSENLVTIAKVGAPHGVHGFVKLNIFTEDPDSIRQYRNWYIQLNHQWQPLSQFELQQKGDQYQIRINNVKDRDQAKAFTNALIAVPRQQLPDIEDENEFYWSDLQGLTVINCDGIELGKVDHLFATGANDVMVVVGNKRHLIPFIRTCVLEVDLAAGKIMVDWDEDFS